MNQINIKVSIAKKYKFIIAGGGTGGHIFPAVAIADALKQQLPSSEILFVGPAAEWKWKKCRKPDIKL